MLTARRLSILALTLALAAVALAAVERPTLAASPQAKAETPIAPGEPSADEQLSLSSPWPRVHQPARAPEQAEREKTFAWLILLLKDQRSAR